MAPTLSSTPQQPGFSFGAALRSFGPGVVFALTVIGPGDLVSNAATGAGYGYSLLWALALSVCFRFVWLDTAARYVMVTGENLMDGYHRLGMWLVWVVLGSMLVIRTLSNLYKIILAGATAQLLIPLPVPNASLWWGLTFTVMAFLIVYVGGYGGVERWLKVLIAFMGGGILTAAILSRPDPAAILHGLTTPLLPANEGAYSAVFVLTALIGTEAGSLTNITYSYFMWQKGWRDLSYQRRQRTDLFLSVCAIFAMGALVQICAATNLKPLGVSPAGADDLVMMFSRTMGTAGRAIFAFGVWAAAFGGFVGGTTGYALIGADTWRRFTKGGESEQTLDRTDPVFRKFVLLWTLLPVALLAVASRPVWLTLLVSALMASLIPVLALALLWLTARRSRMGEHANGWVRNGLLLLMVACSAVLIGANIWNWWDGRS